MRTQLSAALMAVGALTMASCGGEDSETSTSSTSLTESESTGTVRGFDVTPDLTFADGVTLDVYHPTAAASGPVVVFAPGRGGTKADGRPFGETWAENGAVSYVVSMSYNPPFLDAVEDLACAVRFARATAAEYGGDPDEVTLVGFSLGASAGAVVALSGDDHTTGCVQAGTSALPDTFVGYEGAYDWAHADYPLGLDLLEQDDPELWAAIDPYAHVGEHPELVVRLINGVDDNTVWYETAPQVPEEFRQALVDAGHDDVEVILIDGARHSAGYPGAPQFDAMVEQALDTADSR